MPLSWKSNQCKDAAKSIKDEDAVIISSYVLALFK